MKSQRVTTKNKCRSVLVVLGAGLLFQNVAWAQNLQPNGLNRHFDPDQDTPPQNCSRPPLQDPVDYIQPRDGDSFCAASSISLKSLPEAQQHEVALAYAPVLFFHPLEIYTPQKADTTFTDPHNGKIYQQPTDDNECDDEYPDPILVDLTLNLETMLKLSKPDIKNGSSYYFEHVPTEDYKRGAGFEYEITQNNQHGQHPKTVGRSRAPIYYNIIDTGSNTWVINYFFYYTWNGAQTLGIGVGKGRYSVQEIGPYGSHEGDWESMSVLICQSLTTQPSQPLGVTYRAHSFDQITDCTQGECIFYKDSLHPVGFVALGTHATYPVSSRNHVYSAYPFNILYLFPGFVFFADQTVYRNDDTNGSYNMFFPNATNLIRHRNWTDILLDVTSPTDYWQGFGGRWGESLTTGVEPPKEPVRCLNRQQTEWISCPVHIPLIQAFVNFFGSFAVERLGQLIPGIARELQTNNAPFGPPANSFFDKWEAAASALLWSTAFPCTTETSFCTWLGKPIDNVDSDYEEGILPVLMRTTLSVTTGLSNLKRSIIDLCTGGPVS